ncbi:MAG: VWA domain-containing protein [Saprospiraceae bacterium]|nr:VWA domain-containing protein [Saprospiraceae bacterium]MCB0624404.1 VWA domain-containing protein [Saprospiraceae bacterium]
MTKLLLSFLSLFVWTSLPQPNAAPPPAAEAPHIQMALLLDTSNSMDGLIEQAKSQLWKMVNDLATSKKDGQAPQIEIALYEYGNDGLSGEKGYIRQVVALTADLDLVSEQLFSLKTNGGSEYCGWVIKDATEQLEWSADNGDLKIITIAGNEPFTQGAIDFRTSCKTAISEGIIINTIFCGNYEEGVNTSWKEGADLADGKYFNIDPNREIVHVPTPYDDQLLKLNQDLNGTYIGYGSLGEERLEMQKTQDDNAAAYGASNAAQRASFKAKKQYNNAEWDLVDAMEEDEAVLENVSDDALPAEMKEMTKEEQKAFVEAKANEREKIRKEILDLERQANEYREAKLAEMEGEENTLDKVLREAVREQAANKAFEFEKN